MECDRLEAFNAAARILMLLAIKIFAVSMCFQSAKILFNEQTFDFNWLVRATIFVRRNPWGSRQKLKSNLHINWEQSLCLNLIVLLRINLLNSWNMNLSSLLHSISPISSSNCVEMSYCARLFRAGALPWEFHLFLIQMSFYSFEFNAVIITQMGFWCWCV